MAEAIAFRLADKVGKGEAHKLVEEASKKAHAEGRHFKDVLASNPKVTAIIPAADLPQLFDPLGYQGVAQQFIDRLIATAKQGR
jgi:3-carboxy-cis,cis-muconate cycloisomerase